MKEAYTFLRASGVWFLATCENEQPRIRPFDSIRLHGGRLYFQTGRGEPVSRRLHLNPRLELCACRGGDWLRVEASAALDDERRTREALLAPGAADEGDAELWYLRNCTATLYEGSEAVKTWKF